MAQLLIPNANNIEHAFRDLFAQKGRIIYPASLDEACAVLAIQAALDIPSHESGAMVAYSHLETDHQDRLLSLPGYPEQAMFTATGDDGILPRPQDAYVCFRNRAALAHSLSRLAVSERGASLLQLSWVICRTGMLPWVAARLPNFSQKERSE